jgi:cyclopropane fatty-acyl-phospholipid synthase-like methyltransferase
VSASQTIASHQIRSSRGALTTHQRTVVEYFNDTAGDYRLLWGTDRNLGLHCGYFDRERRGHDDAVRHMNRVLAETACIEAPVRVLDAGCGIGGSAIWLAENIGAEVVGVNIHPGQIEQARRLAGELRLEERIRFHVADFCATGLEPESFDVVWALESACYAQDKPALIAEAWRLLKPGGRLIVADGFLTRDELTPNERRIVERWQRGWAIPSTPSKCQFARWLCDAGFHDVVCRDITQHVVPSSRRIYRASLLFYPLGIALYWLGLRSAIQTRGIASGYYQYRARRLGLGIYCVFTARK